MSPCLHSRIGAPWPTPCDGRFRLTLQCDGNLVVHEGTKLIWSSGSALTGVRAGADVDRLEVTPTGGLVIYGRAGPCCG